MAASGTLRIRILGDTRDFERSMKRIKATMATMASGVGTAAAAIGAGFAVVGAPVALAVREFTSLDAAMTKSLAIMGDVSQTMRDDMTAAARQVGKTTKFSAAEAAEAYFFLASAGMDATQQIAAMPQVAKFAQAGMFDLSTATDLATDAQSALGLTSKDAQVNLRNLTRVTDVLVKANTLANASVEQFSEALTSGAAAAARAAGKDIEEVTAVLAVLADRGIKGSEAGTQVMRIYQMLPSIAHKNAAAWATFGVSLNDANGNMKATADIVDDLTVLLKGKTDAQRVAILAELGIEQRMQATLATLLETGDAIRNYEQSLRDAAGTTASVAAKQLESFQARMGLVWDQIKDVAISIGAALMPALEGFAGWLQAHLPKVTAWFDAVSDRFLALVNTTDDGTSQMQAANDALVESARTTFGDDLPAYFDEAGGAVSGFATTAQQSGDDAGQMMTNMWEAWKTIWNDDIGPWLEVEIPRFLVDVVAPAIGTAMRELASTAASSFWQYMQDDFAKSKANNFGLPSIKIPFDTGLFPSFHSGGTFRAPLGRTEGLAMLRDGEQVVPHERANTSQPGGATLAVFSDEQIDRLARAIVRQGNVAARVA